MQSMKCTAHLANLSISFILLSAFQPMQENRCSMLFSMLL
jgi:hypothetical protein